MNVKKNIAVRLKSISTPPNSHIQNGTISDSDVHPGNNDDRLSARGKYLSDNELQPPRQSKSLQSKIVMQRGSSFSADPSRYDIEAINRNSLHLEPLDPFAVKKLSSDNKPPIGKLDKQFSFHNRNANQNYGESDQPRPPILEKRRSMKDVFGQQINVVRKPPRVEEEGTVLRGKLSDVQQSHQRRKERPLYLRMISRAERRKTEEDRKKVKFPLSFPFKHLL